VSVTDWHPDYDWLLLGAPGSRMHADLIQWRANTLGLHDFLPDFHRLQVESWLWRAWCDARITGPTFDIGADTPRRWMSQPPCYYVTFGERDCDVTGDLMTMTDTIPAGSVDTVICTEVLEHVAKPWLAVAEMHRVLRPGGRLFVTAPFFWPEHGRDGLYRDYWRFTKDGWESLLSDFTSVDIQAIAWTREGEWLYHMMRQHEAWGLAGCVTATSGYLVEAVR
jgi:SAM-dependent methyltransferase